LYVGPLFFSLFCTNAQTKQKKMLLQHLLLSHSIWHYAKIVSRMICLSQVFY
jgi:hypothetical protein